jgi:hypothetical protein
MNRNRRTAVTVGALFLLSYFGVFAGSALYGPFVDTPDYLAQVGLHQRQVMIGLLIELLNDAAVIGIAVLLFPILQGYSEGLALGYVGFRVVEAIMLMMSKTGVLTIITLSRDYVAAGAPGDSDYPALGTLALAERAATGQMGAYAFILGALLLYILLYQTKLVPRFIALWGLIAIALLITALVLGAPDLTKGFEPIMLLYFPIVLNELFFAGWLIVKGFNPVAIEPTTIGPGIAQRSSPKPIGV